MSNPNKLLYSVGVSVAVSVLSGILYWYYKYLKKDVMPQKWRRVGTLQQINLFPVKSCAPLKLKPDDEVDCDLLGLRLNCFRDRALMLIDDDNNMVTARAYPKLVLINNIALSVAKLRLCAPEMEPLEINFATLALEAPGKDVQTEVWGVKVEAMMCGDKYDKWFSTFILNANSGLHLVYYPYPMSTRAINGRLINEPYITESDTGTFGDATSYMLMNLASVDDLNARLSRPVDPLQFRGNFHLRMDSPEPYAEDTWGWIKIGNEAVFRTVAPCTRCIFPNINIYTGERDPDGQPLKTLNSYRRCGKHPTGVLGAHLGIRQQGRIKQNDVIYVEDNN